MDAHTRKIIEEIKALSSETRGYLAESLRDGLQALLADIEVKNIEAMKDDIQEMTNTLRRLGL